VISKSSQTIRARSVLGAILLATTGLATATFTLPGPAAAQAVRSYNVPAGSLADAINSFAEQSGAQILYDAALTQGRSSAGLRGRFGIAEGLSRLLADTGVTFRQIGSNVYTLEAAPQASGDAIQLGPVRVEGEGASDGSGYAGLSSGMALTENTRSFTTGGPVTAATGLGLTLRETPQSVTVITRERMDEAGINNLGDVLAQVPGIVYQPMGSPVGGYASLYSRGFSVDSIILDGVPIPSSAIAGYAAIQGLGTLNTDVYDSVTVVRGATGIMTGAGDPSAAISLTRKRPTRDLQLLGSLSLGTWRQRRLVGDVGGPLNEAGTLRARMVGAYEEGRGWKEGYSSDKYVGYGVLEADLSSRTMASLALEFSGDNARGAGPYTGYALSDVEGNPTSFGRSDNPMAEWSGFRDRRIGVTASLEHGFDEDWQLKLVYNHNQVKTRQRFGLAADWPEEDGTVYLHLRSYHIKNTVDSVALKLDGHYELFGRKHDVVAGFNGSWSNEDAPDWYINFDTAVNVYTWNRQTPEPNWPSVYEFGWRYKLDQYGAYAATRLRATERLSLLAGGRVTYWRERELGEEGSVVGVRKESGVFTPYIGMVYDFTPSLSLYASYTTIFNPQYERDVNGDLLDPERGNNLEAGLKGEWFNGRLNASVGLFRVKKDNLAVPDDGKLTPTGGDAYRAEDDTKGRGWEVEVAGEPIEGWRVQGGYTRMVTRDSSGMRLNNDQPVHLFKLFTSWTPAGLSQLTLGGGVTWQSRTYTDWVEPSWLPLYAQGSYAVVNLNARYAFSERLSLAANLNNLFDEVYRTDVSGHDYGAPRNFLFTLRADF